MTTSWRALIGPRAALHPDVEPPLLPAYRPPDPSALAEAFADAAFDCGWSIGAGRDPLEVIEHVLALRLADLGADPQVAVEGIARELRAGLHQGERLRPRAAINRTLVSKPRSRKP